MEAVDGKDALSKLDGNPVHMVITDLNMPNLDGIGLIKGCTEQCRLQVYPHHHAHDGIAGIEKLEGKQAGATGWIVKPFKPEQLISVTKRVLG